MTRRQLGLLIGFLRPHWRGYAVIMLLSLAGAALELLAVVAVVPFFALLLGTPAAAPGGTAARVLAAVLARLPFADPMAGVCALIVGLTLLKSAFAILNEYAIARQTGITLVELKAGVLRSFVDAPYQHFLTAKQGRLTYLYLTSSLSLAFLLQKVPRMAAEAIRIAALVGLLVWFDRRMTGGLVLFGAGTYLLLATMGKRAYRQGARKIETNVEQTIVLGEFLSGIKHLIVFRSLAQWRRQLEDLNAEYVKAFVGNATLQSVPRPVVETAAMTMIFGSILAMKTLAPQSLEGNLPLLAGFAMAAVRMLPSFTQLNAARLDFLTNLPDLEALDEALTRTPRRAAPGRLPFQGLKKGIRFENIHFSYPGRPEVLRGVDLEVARHTSLALVGESGSGKTSILNLLLGLYKPDQGRVLIDGTDLAELDPDQWLARLAVVTQDGFIFHGTVADNIAFGREGFSREDIRGACAVAQALEFVEQLPQGFDTAVGERGLKLSGGQQQRLAIARAVLAQPELLIFDEATSALDSRSEAAVHAAIRSASKGRTVVQVSHRLSTVADSDVVAVLHEGRLAEVGPPAELLARGGRYAELLRLQRT